jgi:hypothetical protein
VNKLCNTLNVKDVALGKRTDKTRRDGIVILSEAVERRRFLVLEFDWMTPGAQVFKDEVLGFKSWDLGCGIGDEGLEIHLLFFLEQPHFLFIEKKDALEQVKGKMVPRKWGAKMAFIVQTSNVRGSLDKDCMIGQLTENLHRRW